MAKTFENFSGNHEAIRLITRGIGAVAILGSMVSGIATACSVDADKYNQNLHALNARTDLLEAVAASTGSKLVDISSLNGNMAGRFVDQDHFMVSLGGAADVPTSLHYLKLASGELEGTRLNGQAKQDIDTELAGPAPAGDSIPVYSERILDIAQDVNTSAVNGTMIDSSDMKVWGASAGITAIGVGMMWASFWRREEY
jgi:hypothetical protein